VILDQNFLKIKKVILKTTLSQDLLMTKYGKSEKTVLSISEHPFLQFQGKTKEGARLDDLKIKSVLMHVIGQKNTK
jgi:hypothetical protein